MKNILEVLKQKESELFLVKRQVECLRFVAPLCEDDPKVPDVAIQTVSAPAPKKVEMP